MTNQTVRWHDMRYGPSHVFEVEPQVRFVQDGFYEAPLALVPDPSGMTDLVTAPIPERSSAT